MKRKRAEVYFYSVYSIKSLKILRGSDRSVKWNIEIVNFQFGRRYTDQKLNQTE